VVTKTILLGDIYFPPSNDVQVNPVMAGR